MSLYDIVGTIIGAGCLLAFLIGTLVLACKESKQRMHVNNTQLILMDKIYRVLCNEYPENVVKKDA